MQERERDRLISLIYEAALDASRWDDVLASLAAATNCAQGNIEIFDPYSDIATRLAPLCDPEFKKSYAAYWGSQFTLRKRTERIQVGRLYEVRELLDMDTLRKSAFFNEWWRPQGMGGGSLGANLVVDGRATALVHVMKRFDSPGFTDEERQTFATMVEHLVRGVEIHRRQRLAEFRAKSGADTLPGGFLLTDGNGLVILSNSAVHEQLRAIGLIENDGGYGRLSANAGRLNYLVAGAARARGDAPSAAGHVDHRCPDGQLLRITVIPCAERDADHRAWLAIDRPVALLHVTSLADETNARIDRLMQAHGLTRAEAAVALEIAAGDGRAAAAGRLGIKETTVRSHLTAIFAKLGLNRQAELARLVAKS